MKNWRAAILGSVLLAATGHAADDFIDQLDGALTVSAMNDWFRARLSGTLDLEGYHFSQPAPGFIDATGNSLFNPRLSLFLDAQLGESIYFFAQGRVDRGFDPSDGSATARVDEYALRLTPSADGRLNVQVGKFATVVGNWVPRHGSWENAFVTAPLLYENLTGIWDAVAARSGAMVLDWAHVKPPSDPRNFPDDKYLRVPIIWGPSYASGASLFGEVGEITYAAEVKNASLAARPALWDDTEVVWQHPTVSGRLGWRPDEMWSFGFSASSGPYLRETAAPTLPSDHGLGDYRETVLAQDVAFAWHHLQFWAEFYEASFAIPGVGNADTFAYYAEVKYRFAPQWSAALRWNQQTFGDLPDDAGGRETWGANKWRIDVAPSYRFTAHTQLKLQYSVEHSAIGPREFSHLIAGQFVVRF